MGLYNFKIKNIEVRFVFQIINIISKGDVGGREREVGS